MVSEKQKYMRTIKYIQFSTVILIMVLSGITGCRTKGGTNTVKNLSARLIFGQGGGVTGKYLEYTLVCDGNLYRNDQQTGEMTFLKKINKKDCRVFFIDAESMGLLKTDFNHPYNINYYIIYHKGVSENKINWGDAKIPPPQEIKDLWNKLWTLTKL